MTNIERGEWWWNTGWPDWSIWASASPAISDSAKTRFQLYLAATVANLTLVAAKAGLPGGTGGTGGTGGSCSFGSGFHTGTIRSALEIVPARFAQILTLTLLASTALPKYILFISPEKAFRPDF